MVIMGDLSRNFSKFEFKCPHCGRLVGPSTALVSVLQFARTAKGAPLHVVSGYRCPTFNASVGGIPGSQHLTGNAADVRGDYATVAEWTSYGAGGLGTKGAGRVTHVDMTPGWHGHVFIDG
jgi:uncharacterized protein YcbK (DUF882 family)